MLSLGWEGGGGIIFVEDTALTNGENICICFIETSQRFHKEHCVIFSLLFLSCK